MSKVIKILVTSICTIIVTVLVLGAVATVLLDMPVFQNYIVGKATRAISEKLGTRVSIDRISLKLISRAHVEGLYVEDLHGDTLLWVRSLDAGIRDVGLSGGGVLLGNVKLRGTRFYMRQTDRGISNLAEILEKLRSDKPKPESSEPFLLRAASLKIEDLSYSYHKYTPQQRPYGINFEDIKVERLDLHASGISVVDDSIALRMHSLAVKEKSGLTIRDMSARRLSVSGSGIHMEKMTLATPDTRANMDYLRLAGPNGWGSFSDFVNEVRIEASIVNSTLGYGTVAYFAPGLKDWKSVYEDVSCVVAGTVSFLEGRIDRLSMRDTRIQDVVFAIGGLPDVERTRFTFDVGGLQTNSRDAAFLMDDIARKKLEPETADMLSRLGAIGFRGHFDGLLTRFKADGDLSTSLGGAGLNLTFWPVGKGTAFDGTLSVDGFDLGGLLQSPSLGRASVGGEVKGELQGSDMTLLADVKMGLLEYNGYPYHDVGMVGKFENRLFDGHIVSHDRNIDFDFQGLVDLNDSIPRYDFDMMLRNADLRALKFNRRDSTSMLSCRVRAKARGTTLDNLNGHLDITDVAYITVADTLRTDKITIKGENSLLHKSITLESPFADIKMKGRISYSELFAGLGSMLQTYIPTMAKDSAAHKSALPGGQSNAEDFYTIKVLVKNAEGVAGALMPGLTVADSTTLDLMFNTRTEKINLVARSKFIEWKGNMISKILVTANNQSDSLMANVKIDKLLVAGMLMPDFQVNGGVKQNRVNIAASFSDPQKDIRALFNANTVFTTSPEGMSRIVARLNPSYFIIGNDRWRLSSGDIVYDSTRIAVDRFRVVSPSGELIAQGVASHLQSDTLKVNLSNFSLKPFEEMIARAGYRVSGITNGYAQMVSALGEGILSSGIRFDSLRVNQVDVAPMAFDARWDMQRKQVSMKLSNRRTEQTVVDAYYRPTDKRYMADVKMGGVDVSLLDPLVEGIIRGTSGSADIDLRVTGGAASLPSINGRIDFPKLVTTVDFTNVAYTLENAVVEAKNNVFTLLPTHLADKEGNKAQIDAFFRPGEKDFGDYNFKVGIEPRGLLVLNTTARNNDLFHGHVRTDGTASITGNKMGVRLSVAAKTADNSSFYMSLSGKNEMADADFLTFYVPEVKSDASEWDQIIERRMAAASTQGKRASTFAIDMHLDVLPNTDFQLVVDPSMGKGIKARGNGSMDITVNPNTGDFRMFGDYQISEGSYNLNLEKLIDRTLTIEPGSKLSWSGDPADATMDVTASYKLKASIDPLLSSDNQELAHQNVNLDCKMHITDKLTNPSFDFAVELADASAEVQSMVLATMTTPEQRSMQFLWLVAFKSFYSDNMQGTMGSSTALTTASDLIFGQISNMVSSDKMNVGLRYKPRDETSSDELDFEFSWAVLGDRLFLDVAGNYDFDNNTDAVKYSGAKELTGDFAFRYLIDRTGNLQAKFFTRTIDEYSENQGLQETGVGIYYREDFNTFADIIRNFRDRFRRKSKRTSATAQPAPATTINEEQTNKIQTNNNSKK